MVSDSSLQTPRHSHPRRWSVLIVASLAVFVTVLDGTIVNVALPSLSRELGASTRELQWIVDAYLLVFTGLLLAAGGLGDRFGRRRSLVAGLAAFAAASAYAGSADTAGALITGRALMGIGAAFIFPATLAIIADVFADPKERAAAIGIWSATSGIAVAAGPIIGGRLLESFWWGSVFYINLPVAALAIAGALAIIPESRDNDAPALDVVWLALSIAAVGSLVYTIIEAPEWGWLGGKTLGGFTLTTLLLVGFVRWELTATQPMLPVRIFRNLRFSAASVSVTAAFFALFGFVFLITQYFQLVLGYAPFEAGVRMIPVAVAIGIASIASPRVAAAWGTGRVVSTGLALMSLGFVWVSAASASTPYIEIVGQMILLGTGLGLTTAPATESIMGSLPVDKAGVGSAVNDTTRELGGTLGVAVIGSVYSSVYVGALSKDQLLTALPVAAREATEESMAAAQQVAPRLGDLAPGYLASVNEAFLSGLSVACLVAAAVAAGGSAFALRYLPARPIDSTDSVETLAARPPEAAPGVAR